MVTRPFNANDAKRLIDEHEKLIRRLNDAIIISESYRSEIVSSSEALVAMEVIEVLKGIPVEEINRGKKGFRVKALRDSGYNSIADVLTASIYNIVSVYGISEDAAYSIKHIANDISAKARQSIKIRLSVDSKTPSTTRLVTAIYKYKSCLPYGDSCRKILISGNRQVRYAIQDASLATNGIKWLFASATKKQKAIDAYNLLNLLITTDYGLGTRTALTALDAISRSTVTEVWQDFSKNSISYFNILEDVNPGVLGTDDAVYGLPEDLAREIQEECYFPDGLLCELRRYQEWGVKYILHLEKVLLGDEMGLGKTIQAIAAMVSLRNTGATHFVVVCPASVIANWCREIRKMSLLSVTKIHSTGRSAALLSWIKTGGVAVTTYETTSHFKLENKQRFSLLVVDEAHYIKNPNAKRTINIKNMRGYADRVLFMTGTALENKVDEMIDLIQMLQPHIASQARGMAFMSTAPQFRTLIAPVYYRRKRDDVLTELPELIETNEWCTLLPEEEQLYEQAILGKHYADARRVSWNVDNLSRSSKAKRLLEIAEEAESEGRKIIVFSFFLDTIQKITMLLGDKCLNPINGSVPPQRRQEIIDEFDNANAGTVLVAQIQTGGTGLNIQSASVVIICEPQFKPSTENQAISRAYRMGQTRNVLVYRLLCENTIDERITSILENKQAIFDAFADKSVAASESMAIDDQTFGDIIKDEIDRINAKHGINKTERVNPIIEEGDPTDHI